MVPTFPAFSCLVVLSRPVLARKTTFGAMSRHKIIYIYIYVNILLHLFPYFHNLPVIYGIYLHIVVFLFDTVSNKDNQGCATGHRHKSRSRSGVENSKKISKRQQDNA
jgi:hypothetical protein